MLIDATTQCLIQGITGKEGLRALEWMSATGMKVVAGVTPGKGGQEVTATRAGKTIQVPVYDSVAEALAKHSSISLAAVYVPPKFALSAVKEDITAGIPLIHVLAEGVPSKDTMMMIELARQASTPSNTIRIIGPSSIGFAVPGVGAVGSMGGGQMSQYLAVERTLADDAKNPLLNHGVCILSKSGGMANTVASMLTLAGIPQTLVVAIGGDRLIGTSYADLLPLLANDTATKAVLIVGEIGGAYEEVLAEEIKKQEFKKPVIVFISGLFAETLPKGVAFGHAGAIVSKTEGSRQSKINALTAAGAIVVPKLSDIVQKAKEVLTQKDNHGQ